VLEKHTHQYTKTTTASTCTKQGEEVEKCACGDTKTTQLPLADHKPSATVVGKDTVCTVCGKVLAKAGHVHKYVEMTTDSTCTKQGEKVEKCECGDVKSKMTLPLADHKPSAVVSGKDIVCTVCGKVLEQGMKPTAGANLTAGEVYQNAYYNTNQLGSYSTKYSVTIDKKVLLGFAAVGATISGNLKTVNEETTGTTKIALSGDSLDCVYEYPIMSKTGKRFARLTLSNGKYLYVPFDLADTNTGIVVSLPKSALSKMTFDKSSRTKAICSLTNMVR
jgi:phage FluMu protein Com